MLFSILQENLDLFDIEKTRLLSVKILDTSSAASLFVTLLGALLVRQQFVLGFRPRINYKSMRTTGQNLLNNKEASETWQVKISNAGLGAAIIIRTGFNVETTSSKRNSAILELDKIVEILQRENLVRDRDYRLGNMTNGFTLPSKEEYVVFEIKTEALNKLKRLDMILHFQGLLGDRYFREIFLIPTKIITIEKPDCKS